MNRWNLAAILFAMIFATGCTRVSDFTMISSKNVLLGLDQSQFKGTFEGEDSKLIFLIIPLGLPNMKEAADRAIEKGKGNLLINAVIYERHWYIPLLIGENAYVVKGDVYSVTQPTKKEN